jgi:hypothetical protein
MARFEGHAVLAIVDSAGLQQRIEVAIREPGQDQQ